MHKTHIGCEPLSNQLARSRLIFSWFHRKKQDFKSLILRDSPSCLEGGDPPHPPPLTLLNHCCCPVSHPFGVSGGIPPNPLQRETVTIVLWPMSLVCTAFGWKIKIFSLFLVLLWRINGISLSDTYLSVKC